ncbi:MAG TPA: Hsp20/alpha crystallin family protein [Candidatus Omnitrophota bacterium]|nr:Hsp20/alpha crystallin family protein [Candidatus Omnitrophota bacterium]
MKKILQFFFLLFFIALFARTGFSEGTSENYKYYIGKVAILNASKNEVTILEYNSNQEKTFVAAEGIPTNLSLGQEVIVVSDENSEKIVSLKMMGAPLCKISSSGKPLSKAPMAPSFYDDPFEQRMRALQSRMQSLFDDEIGFSFRDPLMFSGLSKQDFFDPKVDWKEEKKAYVFQMDIPDMKKDNINVEIKNGLLIISGNRTSSVEEESPDRYHRQERSFGHFLRSFALPKDADDKKFDVKYENGVLKVTIPKKK